jgi:5S rRNA maturation endonuclease (ribonuclease M5)
VKDPQDVLDGLDDVIERLHQAATGGVVIVEGLRDAAALERLGVRGNISVLHRGATLLEFCEQLASRERNITILVDWDTKGDALAKRLREGVTQGAIKVDTRTREDLRRLTRGSIKAVEELPSFYRRVQAAAVSKRPVIKLPRDWKARKERAQMLSAARQMRASKRDP